MDENTDINAVDLTFAAFFLPPLIALINQRTWRKEIKGLVFLAVCLAYSVVVVVLREETEWNDWRGVILQVFAGTAASYSWFWGPTRLGPAIETSTSVKRETPEDQEVVGSTGALYDE